MRALPAREGARLPSLLLATSRHKKTRARQKNTTPPALRRPTNNQNCPEFCLGLEVFCCFAQSVASTRWLVQDELGIKNTSCDDCIIGTMIAAQYLACVCSIAACLTGSDEINDAARLLGAFYVCVCVGGGRGGWGCVGVCVCLAGEGGTGGEELKGSCSGCSVPPLLSCH